MISPAAQRPPAEPPRAGGNRALQQRLRLWSGLVLFAYVTTHLANHALGVVSVDAMEAGRTVFAAVWRSWPGIFLLAGSFAVHATLAVAKLFRARHLRMPLWEAAQQVLGLTIPFLLAVHAIATLGLHLKFGVDPTYPFLLWEIWQAPVQQTVLLAVVWVHGCIGIHFWLRIRPWYRHCIPFAYAAALLIPVCAFLGTAVGGRDTLVLAGADPDWVSAMIRDANIPGPETAEWVYALEGTVLDAAWIVVGLLVVWRGARTFLAARRRRVRITYPDGQAVGVSPGTTVLEASRQAGIPHASVCGGRGRCSTCRVRVHDGAGPVPEPSEHERAVLDRIGAPEGVRLACQLAPRRDVTITPLLPASAGPADARLRHAHQHGAERDIAILFADLRAFTRLSERKLPFDVVFLLNQYFRAMGRSVEAEGGHVDKFIGDGIMALFGLNDTPEAGCRHALRAVRSMAATLDDLNSALRNDLPEPLRIGIGLHAGPVIVGEMGYRTATSITAIGDAVNVASRLETMTKGFSCQAVISQRVVRLAGADLSARASRLVEVRGREKPLSVYTLGDGREIALPTGR